MPILLHAIIAASYFLLATALALLLPLAVPWMTAGMAPFAGGIVFLAGALLHVAFAQSERNRRTLGELNLVRRQAREIAQDLLDTQTRALQMRQAMEQAGKAGEQRVSQVVAEVKVLQGLIEVFSQHQARAGGMSASAGGRPHLVAMPGGRGGQAHALAGDYEEPEVVEIVREALREDRVDVYLQPIVSLPQRKMRYYECFTRIRTDDGKVIGPGQYIELAERAGLVSAIDNMLLFRTVQLIRRTQRRNFDTAFFCNISKESLADTDFIGDFVDFVSENPDLAPKIYFEFAQEDIEHAPPATIGNLARLAELGFRFSLDGVDSLTFDFAGLSARNFRFVKVDAAALLHADDPVAGDIAPEELKKSLDRHGLDMIVEKVETERQVVELLDYGIDYGQGYLFGEPRLSRAD